MSENQKSIAVWANNEFGFTTLTSAWKRYMKEHDEAVLCRIPAELAAELPDLLITLYRVAEVIGIDLHEAVDAKMRINRAREWDVGPDGTGQHK